MNTKVVLLIVAILVIVGIAYYSIGERPVPAPGAPGVVSPTPPAVTSPALAPTPGTITNEVAQIEAVSDSDSIDTLKQELQTTEISNLANELKDIEEEINAALSEK